MAKKMPKNNGAADTAAALPEKDETTEVAVVAEAKPEKAAVAVDSKKAEPKKNKKPKKNPDKPNIFKRMWKGLKGIFSELKKVTWPTGKNVVKSTAVVLVVVVAFFVVLFGIDYVLSGLLSLIVNGEWAFVFIGQ